MDLSLLFRYKWIILFYLALITFFYIKRKQVVVQAKIIFLLRTVVGVKLIERFSEKYREWVKLWGYIGVGVGFIGMVIITCVLVFNFFQLFLKPEQAPGVSLVLPGVEIPGLGILPFWHWLIAIFVIATIHEFAHGIVAHAHGLKVKFTGLVLFGPIIGAFVEPDEKKLLKVDDIVQHSVYAAGAFANIFLAVVAFVILGFVLTPIQQSLVEPVGFSFNAFYEGDFPAKNSGLQAGDIITGVDDLTVTNFNDFATYVTCVKPGEEISLTTSRNKVTLAPAAHPDDETKPFLGIAGFKNEQKLKNEGHAVLNSSLLVFMEFFRWLFILSFGIGLFNLLPLPIVDGGRMLHLFFVRLYGQKKGTKRFGMIGMMLLVILVLSLILPLFL